MPSSQPADTQGALALPLLPTHEESMLRETVARIAAGFGPRYFAEKIAEREPPAELWKALGDGGFLGVNLPEEHGGGGLGMAALSSVTEELAAEGCPMLQMVTSQAIGGSILSRHATPEQRERWLPGMASGELVFAFAITEPNAGSNSHELRTRARRDGDKYVLRGTKTFISGVEAADELLVVARTGEHDGGKGRLSLFVLPTDAPGLERQEIPTVAPWPEQQWQLFFDDVEVDADRLVGGEHEGLKAVFDGLNPERIMAAAICTGVGRHTLARAAQYACERNVWGAPIGSHQGVAHPLAQAKIELELARLMTHKAAALYDAGLPAGEASNMAKFAAAEAGIRCVDQAIQTHGGNGFALEYGLTDQWWSVRLIRTIPVSREMILNFVAERSLGLPRSY